MLLCIIYGTDVIVPISCIMLIIYFIFNSGMVNNILSQMCGRLYFPIFLLRVGLFTLMYMDSLMALARLLSSLPIILKLSKVVSWPLLLCCRNIGDGAFRCSLYLSPNVFTDSPIYSSSQSIIPQV